MTTILPRLHYVSQGQSPEDHLQYIKRACAAGCPWIQLRLKEVDLDTYIATAQKAKIICQQYGALLTINDQVAVAAAIEADGLHLGKEDMPPSIARPQLPKDMLIGGTANTWEDILRLQAEQVDYIGLGPFTMTSTKKKLSPILGLAGYQDLLAKMQQANINIPVLAIGGIQEKDVVELKQTGIWGIAVSGLISHATNPKSLCEALLQTLNQ